jgi:hypothetical protein
MYKMTPSIEDVARHRAAEKPQDEQERALTDMTVSVATVQSVGVQAWEVFKEWRHEQWLIQEARELRRHIDDDIPLMIKLHFEYKRNPSAFRARHKNFSYEEFRLQRMKYRKERWGYIEAPSIPGLVERVRNKIKGSTDTERIACAIRCAFTGEYARRCLQH